MNRSVRRWAVVLPCALMSLSAAFAVPREVRSFRELRFERVVGQTDPATCGPAALATLFTFYLERPVGEETFTRTAARHMAARGQDWREGLSLSALRAASRAHGVPADAYEMTPGQLREHLTRGVPALVNLTRPVPHFAVVVAMPDGAVLLADPSRGQRTESTTRFLDSWNGVVLTVTPDAATARTAKRNVERDVTRLMARREQLRGSR